MNIKDLEYLIAVHDLGSFSKAARRCGVGQSTLSTQIKKLEENLGLILFIRDKSRVLPDLGAKEIFDKARQVVNLVAQMKDVAEDLQDPYSGQLRIGAFPTVASYLLPKYAKAIRLKYKKIKLVLHEEKSDVLTQKLLNRDIDCAIIAEPIKHPQVEKILLFKDEFFLAVPSMHCLSRKNSVSISDLKDEKLLLLEEGHCLRDQALDVCELADFSEEDFQATSMLTLLEMVKLGSGITLIPAIAKEKTKDLNFLPFKNPAPFRSIMLVYLKNGSKNKLIKEIANILRELS